MSTATAVALRPFTPEDLTAAYALTTAFQWPHRLEDWAFMSRLGDGVVAEQGGALLGTAFAWPYGTQHAALGMVGVLPAAQGGGLGRKMMTALIDQFGQRDIVLHATKAGLPLYQSLGFVTGGTVRQHQGAAYRAALMPLAAGERLRPIGQSDAPVLAALDEAATGMDRHTLLAALLGSSGGVVLDCQGTVTGFALLRRFGRGHVIGPVVALSHAAAQAMISHLLGQHAGAFIRIDVPEKACLSGWLQELGLADAGPAIRMVRGTAPQTGIRFGTYTLASQAFG